MFVDGGFLLRDRRPVKTRRPVSEDESRAQSWTSKCVVNCQEALI
jgi:hypothetical protein